MLEATNFIEQLINRRVKLGLTMREVAEKGGFNMSQMSDFETMRRVPSVNMLSKWANALDMKLVLVDGSE